MPPAPGHGIQEKKYTANPGQVVAWAAMLCLHPLYYLTPKPVLLGCNESSVRPPGAQPGQPVRRATGANDTAAGRRLEPCIRL
jgi:hypothetical protein